MGRNLQFCLAIFLGLPTLQLPSQVLSTQSETNKKVIAVRGRQRINHHWVPESKFRSHNSKIWFLQIYFACYSELGKERTTWNFTFLSQPGTTDRDQGELILERILNFFHHCPVFPGSHLQGLVHTVSQGVLSWSADTVDEETEFSLYQLWWVLGWDPFFSRPSHKWISLSRLKVLHCGHCNLRWSLVRLTCLFSLKTRFYSPEASHWPHASLSHIQSSFQVRPSPARIRSSLFLKIGPELPPILFFFFFSPKCPQYIVVYSSCRSLWLCYVGHHLSMAWWAVPCPHPGCEQTKPPATEAEHANLTTWPWGGPSTYYFDAQSSVEYKIQINIYDKAQD